jgi:membrane-associated phospholipid phosphatase
MILVIIMISISRNYLGVHFPSDSIAGLLAGGLILLLFLRFEGPVKDRLRGLSTGSKIFIAALFTLLLLVVGLSSFYLTRERAVPTTWINQAMQAFEQGEPIDPNNVESLVSNSATLFGISIGAILLLDWGRFKPEGTWGQRIGRYIVGLIGLVLLFFGLRLLFPTQPDLLGAVFRFLRYALVGFWVAYLAPRLFVKLRLA